jgi:hypothetical protein
VTVRECQKQAVTNDFMSKELTKENKVYEKSHKRSYYYDEKNIKIKSNSVEVKAQFYFSSFIATTIKKNLSLLMHFFLCVLKSFARVLKSSHFSQHGMKEKRNNKRV